MAKKTKETETPSREPYLRALERIEALEARGQDARAGTLRRLHATTNPDKILGIYEAALNRGWTDITQTAKEKLDLYEANDHI